MWWNRCCQLRYETNESHEPPPRKEASHHLCCKTPQMRHIQLIPCCTLAHHQRTHKGFTVGSALAMVQPVWPRSTSHVIAEFIACYRMLSLSLSHVIACYRMLSHVIAEFEPLRCTTSHVIAEFEPLRCTIAPRRRTMRMACERRRVCA